LLKIIAFVVNETDIIDYFRDKDLDVINVKVARTSDARSKCNGFEGL